MKRLRFRFPCGLTVAVLGAFLAGCACMKQRPDVCSNSDGALSGAFVFVTEPNSGARVSSGFAVRGCSRTFESTVNWKLRARNGNVLASGFTTGGGVDAPAPFAFNVAYSVSQRQIGHLEVFEEDVSDGAGFPPPRDVIPLVLQP
jgi:hypothetical protein